ncbi:hypothetical protein [Fibrivirga algicola]|uniref:Uncharacterized protein n=1 Tax=Fibrivirga algicola TaxID=2950420 RepID=A0ABX0QE68_9BACT|nr:hypothetical protein [Fibrivirga algicola]NID10456.1 hypothetical protein [Fibrivirga algicola]
MKSLIILFLLLTGTLASAQQVSYRNVNTSINDNGKDQLSIQIQAERTDGEQLRYNRTFNVAGLSNAQKETLKNKVLDSLGLNTTPPPPGVAMPPVGAVSVGAPTPPVSPTGTETVRFTCRTCTDKMKLDISGTGYAYSRSHSPAKENASFFPIDLPLEPGEYRLQYWQNGVLQIQMPFTVKAGGTNAINVK